MAEFSMLAQVFCFRDAHYVRQVHLGVCTAVHDNLQVLNMTHLLGHHCSHLGGLCAFSHSGFGVYH